MNGETKFASANYSQVYVGNIGLSVIGRLLV